MAKLPTKNTTKKQLDCAFIDKSYGRKYLGMSSIGDPCSRKLYYSFHLASRNYIRPRTQRIFDVGHSFEAIIISELKRIGVEVYKIENGKKVELTGHILEDQEELLGFCGHESGHSDGRAKGFVEFPNIEMLLELKTMKEVYFNQVKKQGFETTQPVYYGQVQRYMLAKKLKKVCFIAINKNTCEYHVEFSDFNEGVAKDLARKARDIILSDAPPPKAFIAGYYKCRNCNSEDVCHNGREPEMNCRTCVFVDIADHGEWHCSNKRHIEDVSKGKCEDEYSLSFEEQKRGCDQYKKGWGL